MHIWSKAWGNALDQESTSLAVDPSDNVIIGGYFDGAVNFGCGVVSAGVGDSGLVLKLDPTGNCLWVKHFGDPTTVNEVAIDAAGNVVATGFSEGTVDFGGGPLPGGGQRDTFIVKFDAAGNYVWGKRFGDGADQNGLSIAVDGAGNIFAAGSFQGTVNFGGTDLVSQGGTDIYLAKFGPAGNHLWSKRFGDASNQLGRTVAVDAAGNVVLAGNLIGTANFGGTDLTSPGLGNVFIAKLDPLGVHLWSATYGDAADQYAQAIKVDGAGNVYACGTFDGTINFGGQTLTTMGGYDVWVLKLKPDGAHVWSWRGGGPNNQSCQSVAIDAAGRVAVGGWFYGSGSLGGGPLVSAGQQDGFLALYDPLGNNIWSMLYGDGGGQANKGLAFDGAGYLLTTAFETGAIDLGGGPKVGGGGEDIFAAKLLP